MKNCWKIRAIFMTFSQLSKNTFSTFATGTLTLAMLTACTPADKAKTQSNAEKTETTSTTSTTTATATPDNNNKDNNKDNGKPIIYASTNVWGAVAQAIGGENVNIIVGVNEPTQDPHDYQATAQDKLNISKAKLVLVNGGGYDDWASSLAKAINPQPVVINAVKVSGFTMPAETAHDDHAEHTHEKDGHDEKAHDEHADHEKEGHNEHEHHHHHGEFNEHVFYSLDTANKVAQAIANQLSQSDPSHKAQYTQNLQAFTQQITELKTQAKATPTGKTAFFTEPVAGYLLADMGIKNVTPEEFVEQSETDAGVSAKVLKDTKALITGKQASVLVLNAQTEDATSKILVEDAKTAQVPVVNVYETLPAPLTAESKGNAYLDFMKKAISDLQQALGK